jgi:hypothetical protein
LVRDEDHHVFAERGAKIQLQILWRYAKQGCPPPGTQVRSTSSALVGDLFQGINQEVILDV